VLGRPTATTHAGIERATFKLFVEYGFDETTLAMIVAEVGIGRRTLFRYFASKNDIPWGQFEQTLARFRDLLAAQPRNLPVLDALGRGVVAFNSFDDDALPAHAARTELILRTPTLRAHSSLKCWEWRTIAAEFVADRLGQRSTDLRPQLLSQVALVSAVSAYEQWLDAEGRDNASLVRLLEEALSSIRLATSQARFASTS
jgi:mycofactocin system transcriptional regulator